MAVSVVVNVNQSETIGAQPITVTATFTNTGTALTILSVDRLGPSAAQGVSDGSAVACDGFTVAAGTSVVSWKWFPPQPMTVTIQTLQYRFRLSDASVVTPSSDPQVATQSMFAFTPGRRNKFPTPGSLDGLSNVQSGLFGAI